MRINAMKPPKIWRRLGCHRHWRKWFSSFWIIQNSTSGNIGDTTNPLTGTAIRTVRPRCLIAPTLKSLRSSPPASSKMPVRFLFFFPLSALRACTASVLPPLFGFFPGLPLEFPRETRFFTFLRGSRFLRRATRTRVVNHE